jgi:hypothetical protein
MEELAGARYPNSRDSQSLATKRLVYLVARVFLVFQDVQNDEDHNL